MEPSATPPAGGRPPLPPPKAGAADEAPAPFAAAAGAVAAAAAPQPQPVPAAVHSGAAEWAPGGGQPGAQPPPAARRVPRLRDAVFAVLDSLRASRGLAAAAPSLSAGPGEAGALLRHVASIGALAPECCRRRRAPAAAGAPPAPALPADPHRPRCHVMPVRRGWRARAGRREGGGVRRTRLNPAPSRLPPTAPFTP